MSFHDKQHEEPAPTAVPPKLRVAIAGAGGMARHHVAAIRRLSGCARVCGIADPNEARRKELAADRFGVSAYGSLEKLLDAVEVDVVHVCTPPSTHEALARVALEAGCHAYIEKPFTENESSALALLDLARTRKLHLCAGHQLLFERPAREAFALLPALGNLLHVESFFSFSPLPSTADGVAPPSVHLQLLDMLPHPVYLLLAFLNAETGPEPVQLRSVELGRGGTIHALLRHGPLTGTLVITPEGRPIESYIRLVGDRGSIYADFVRGTVQRSIGASTSTINKSLYPYRLAVQLMSGTTAALASRLLANRRSYPGLVELIGAFYDSIRHRTDPPLSSESMLNTVTICNAISERLQDARTAYDTVPKCKPTAPVVVVTGGTGFLGRELVRQLVRRGASVRVFSRRLPAPWDSIPGVHYVVADLGRPLSRDTLTGASVVIHCAAETTGGWDAHRRNSVSATKHLLTAASEAGISNIVYVSSLSVLGVDSGPITERGALLVGDTERGPYVWGKCESERLALEIASEHSLRIKILRPAAVVDSDRFQPPGLLGRRIGPVFIAVGRRHDPFPVVELSFCADIISWVAQHFNDAPPLLNLIDPIQPTRSALLRRLKRLEPRLKILWLPNLLLWPLSWLALVAQRILRPNQPAVHLRKVFSIPTYDNSAIRELVSRLADRPAASASAGQTR